MEARPDPNSLQICGIFRCVEVPQAFCGLRVCGFGEHIDSNQRHGLAGFGDNGEVGNPRTDANREGKHCKRRHRGIRHAAGGGHFQIRIAHQCFHRRSKGSGRGVSSEIDRENHRDSKSHREHRQRGAQRLAHERSDNQSEEQPKRFHISVASLLRCGRRACELARRPLLQLPRCASP